MNTVRNALQFIYLSLTSFLLAFILPRLFDLDVLGWLGPLLGRGVLSSYCNAQLISVSCWFADHLTDPIIALALGGLGYWIFDSPKRLRWSCALASTFIIPYAYAAFRSFEPWAPILSGALYSCAAIIGAMVADRVTARGHRRGAGSYPPLHQGTPNSRPEAVRQEFFMTIRNQFRSGEPRRLSALR